MTALCIRLSREVALVLPFFILFFLVLYGVVTIFTWQEKRKRRRGPKILLIPRGVTELNWVLADFYRLLAYAAPEAEWWVMQPEEEAQKKAVLLAERRWGYHILQQEEGHFDIILPLVAGETSQRLQGQLIFELKLWQEANEKLRAGKIIHIGE